MANRPIVNFDELELTQQRRSAQFDAATARLGPIIRMDQLGAQLHIVAPGKAAWPRHAHHTNEEPFIILDGAGEYQKGDKVWPIRKDDVIASPAGFAETAHQSS